jgi:hypothetical protein
MFHASTFLALWGIDSILHWVQSFFSSSFPFKSFWSPPWFVFQSWSYCLCCELLSFRHFCVNRLILLMVSCCELSHGGGSPMLWVLKSIFPFF